MPSRSRLSIVRLLLAGGILAAILVAAAALTTWWFLSSDRVRQAIEWQAARALGEPVRIERATADLLPRPTVRLLGVHVGERGERAQLQEVRLSTRLRPLLSRQIEGAEVTIRGGRLDLAGLLGMYQAASRRESDDAPGGTGVSIGSIESIVLEDVDLEAAGAALRTRGRARLDDGRLQIERVHAHGAGSDFELSGTITTGPAPSAALSLQATTLDVEALAALAGAIDAGAGSQPGPGASPAVRLAMTVRAARGTLAGIAFTDLDTRVEATGQQIRLEPLATSLFDGRFAGSMQVTPATGGAALRIVGTLENADASAVLAHLERSPEMLSGRLTANLRIDQAPGTTEPLIERLRGTVGVSARGGSIQGLASVSRAVVDFSGRAERTEWVATDRYEQLTATFGMAGGRLDTRDLTLSTDDLEVLGRGSIDLVSGRLALDADLALSPELSKAAGRDLLRYAREDDRVVLPGHIAGTFAEPTVRLDVADAARRAIRNRLEEEASSILERLRRGGRREP